MGSVPDPKKIKNKPIMLISYNIGTKSAPIQ